MKATLAFMGVALSHQADSVRHAEKALRRELEASGDKPLMLSGESVRSLLVVLDQADGILETCSEVCHELAGVHS